MVVRLPWCLVAVVRSGVGASWRVAVRRHARPLRPERLARRPAGVVAEVRRVLAVRRVRVRSAWLLYFAAVRGVLASALQTRPGHPCQCGPAGRPWPTCGVEDGWVGSRPRVFL